MILLLIHSYLPTVKSKKIQVFIKYKIKIVLSSNKYFVENTYYLFTV